MRVTSGMLVTTSIRDMYKNTARMNSLWEQQSSLKKINKLSDDPVGLMSSLRNRTRLYVMATHQKNLDSADSWLTELETGVSEVNEILKTLYTDAIDAASDTKSADDRYAIAQKVKEFRDQLINAGNITVADRYVLSGNSTKTPFEVKNNVLYYNGYNMYASTETKLNPEQFSQNLHGVLNTAAAGSMAADGNALHQELTSVLDAAGKAVAAAKGIYDARQVDNGSGELIKPSSVHMIAAMNDYITSSGLGGEELKAAQAAVDSAQDAMDAGADITQIMNNLNFMMANGRDTLKELGDKNKQAGGTGIPIADAQQFAVDALTKETDAATKAVFGATTGLADEAAKKYEIEIGYGQLLNVTMNGIEVFGMGKQNVYKLLDDFYNALTHRYMDTSQGTDGYANVAAQLYNPADALGVRMGVDTAVQKVIDAALRLEGSDTKKIRAAMEGAKDNTWSTAQTAAADAIIKQVEEGVKTGVKMDSIRDGLREAAKASTAVGNAGTDALAKAAQDAYYAAYLTSDKGVSAGSSADDITSFISRFQESRNDMSGHLAIIGGRTNRVEIVQERYALDEINYIKRISLVEDVDIAELTMQMKMAEAVYQSSLSAMARAIQPSLMDYLR